MTQNTLRVYKSNLKIYPKILHGISLLKTYFVNLVRVNKKTNLSFFSS